MNKKPTATVRSRPSAPTLTVVADAPVTSTQAAETTTPPHTSPKQTQGIRTMINSSVDFAAIGKENLEAFAASGKIWAAGVQDLTKQFAATAKASLEEFVATFKALTSVKSVKEAIDLQSTYGKTAVAKALAEFDQADRSLVQADRTGAGADHRAHGRRGRGVHQGRLIAAWRSITETPSPPGDPSRRRHRRLAIHYEDARVGSTRAFLRPRPDVPS